MRRRPGTPSPVPGGSSSTPLDATSRFAPGRSRVARPRGPQLWRDAARRYRGSVQSSTVPDRFRPLVDATAVLAERFRRAGHRIYLVGGSVRDALVERPGSRTNEVAIEVADNREPAASDYDLTTDARPEEIERIVRGWADQIWTQGKRFGTIGCRAAGRTYEITTHRAEAYRPDSRKPEVTFGDDVETDLSRRDFTVNAMALELPDLRLVDPFDGLGDLAAHRLRTPLDPELSFDDDPLRMLRAARFAAAYNLVPDAALVEAVRNGHHRLSIVSAERIRDELDKILVLPAPGPSHALRFVVETGLADEFLPELPALRLEQDPVHRHKDVLAHTLAVVDRTSPDRLVRLAALFHDVGKPGTRAFGPEGATFHHHDVVGARMTRHRMEALRYSKEDTDVVVELVRLHLRFHTYRLGWSDHAVRRYVRDAGPLLERLNALTRSDCTTRNEAKARALARRMDELERRIVELREQEELDAIRPDLNGTQVMARLGIAPGREVGDALAFLLELRLDEGPLGEEEAGRRLDRWWAERGAPA
jgi:poly(A) polymerase